MMLSGTDRVRRFLFYSIFEGRFEIGKFKLVTRFLEPFRFDASAVKKQRIAHFAENEADRKFGKRQKGRAIKHLTEGFSKFFVRHRIRARDIHRAAKIFIFESEVYDVDDII